MLCLITCKVMSEKGYGFLRPGLKTGVGNGIFWSEIGSGFGDAGGTPPPKIPRSTPGGGGTCSVFPHGSPSTIFFSSFCCARIFVLKLMTVPP